MRDSMTPNEAAQLKELLASGLSPKECYEYFPLVEPTTVDNFYPTEKPKSAKGKSEAVD
jgi:hypothetical protein